MASNALSILSGIGAAAAGLAGEKVSKSGTIPGLDIATIIPALLGNKLGAVGAVAEGIAGKAGKAGKTTDILGKVASVASIASKAGLLKNTKLEGIAGLAGSLLSIGKASGKSVDEGAGGIAGLAAAIMGGSGDGSSLASIASMALKLGKGAEDNKSLLGMATSLGKSLSGDFGVSFAGSSAAVKALDNVLEEDPKTDLFKSILKGLAK